MASLSAKSFVAGHEVEQVSMTGQSDNLSVLMQALECSISGIIHAKWLQRSSVHYSGCLPPEKNASMIISGHGKGLGGHFDIPPKLEYEAHLLLLHYSYLQNFLLFDSFVGWALLN